ncbi:MAG: GMC oxidoreductase [Bdellovibrionota bacterium]
MGCGDCFTGCNVGAKRSVNTTYLATAAANGAQIWTDTHVKKISHKNSNEGGYYKIHIHEAGPDATLKSKLVIVAAGTMGTNNILMNSQGNDKEALDLSKNIGQHFSANGDVIGFGFTKERRLNGGGPGLDNLNNHNRVGAVVESIIDHRNGDNIYDHIAAVDACIPSAVSAPITGSIRGVKNFTARLKADANAILKIFINNDGKEEIPEDDLAGFDKFFTFLVLNHDQSKGKLTKGPEKGYAKPEFPEYGQQPEDRNFIDKSNELMTKIMEAMGGKFIPGGPNSSVHPLGGVRMSADHNRGGCDLSGRVYKSKDGKTNPGLFVCDASVMPMSTGIHPFLTISALAEKISEQIINSDEFKQILNS